MKRLSTLFLLWGWLVSAQNTRVIYEYQYAPDSTKADSLKTEWMYLDITKKGSKYYSKKAFEKDSVMIESIKKQMASGMKSISVSRQSYGGEINDEVEKIYPDYKTFLMTTIGSDSYKVVEDRKVNWQISPEKKQLAEFNVQKATADFAGRKWVAWFTPDVPLQDGPYKFSGLPGLIIEIYDATGTHKMELKALKKIPDLHIEELNTQGKEIPFTKKKPIEVNRQQYVKQLERYQNDPVQGIREMLARPNSKVKMNVEGKEIVDPAEVLRTMEQKAREEMARNNNKIEKKL